MTASPGSNPRTTSFTYDAAGNVTRIDAPGSRWSEFDYDSSGWLEEVRTSAGGKITYQYDLLGNMTRTDFRTTGGVSQSHFISGFDELGRLRSLLGGAGDLTEWDYDRSDRLTDETDGLGRTWLTAFDPLDRVLSVTDPEADTETLDWSPLGGIETFSDGRALTTTYIRNGFGEVIREVSPDRGTTDYWYDAAGRLTRVLTAAGRDTRYTYDFAGRLTARTYPNQPSLNVSFGYDDEASGNRGKGRLTSMSGGVSDRDYTYNVFGELTGEVSQLDAQIYGVGYTYATNGDLSRVIYPSGREVDFTYDGGGRIASIQTRANSGSSSFSVLSGASYAPYGPLTDYTFGNGVVAAFDHDTSYRLKRIYLTNTGGAILDKTYSYDTNSRVTGIVDAVTPSANAVYTYHLDGRLRRATGIWGDVEWTYDAVGNRILEETFNSGTFLSSATYNYPSTSNRLLGTVSDQNVSLRTFTHTPDGHITLETKPGSATDYSYTEDSRLEQIVGNAGLIAEFGYDAFERRVWRNLPNVEGVRHFVFLPDGRLLGEYDGSNGFVVREYIWMDDQLVGSVDASGTLSYLQTGPLGQPLIVMNGSGIVIWRGELAPFGQLVSSSFGPVPDARFLGQWDEAGSGLYQNWHRTYDASLGRYLEADPLGIAAGQSLYGYVAQDPTNAVDPAGLLPGSGGGKSGGKSGSGGFGRAGAVGAAVGALGGYLGAINNAKEAIPGLFGPRSATVGDILDDMREEIERICRPLITPWPVFFSPPVSIPIEGDFDPPENECQEQANSDFLVCRALPKSSRGRCWISANERYSACVTGKPIPPLETAWRPGRR
jgi:RHS repeat-associated protein